MAIKCRWNADENQNEGFLCDQICVNSNPIGFFEIQIFFVNENAYEFLIIFFVKKIPLMFNLFIFHLFRITQKLTYFGASQLFCFGFSELSNDLRTVCTMTDYFLDLVWPLRKFNNISSDKSLHENLLTQKSFEWTVMWPGISSWRFKLVRNFIWSRVTRKLVNAMIGSSSAFHWIRVHTKISHFQTKILLLEVHWHLISVHTKILWGVHRHFIAMTYMALFRLVHAPVKWPQ